MAEVLGDTIQENPSEGQRGNSAPNEEDGRKRKRNDQIVLEQQSLAQAEMQLNPHQRRLIGGASPLHFSNGEFPPCRCKSFRDLLLFRGMHVDSSIVYIANKFYSS